MNKMTCPHVNVLPPEARDLFKIYEVPGASWCNLTDDATTCAMMTSLCVIELIILGFV